MSSPPPTTPQLTIFFIDRCLGSKKIVAALRQAGITVEIHDDHFLPDAADVDWLPKVGEWGWVVLTKDANIARRTLEKIAVTHANVQLFILTAQQLASTDMIAILLKAIVPMQQFVHKYPAPFIAKIHRDSRLEMWRDREALLAELHDLEDKSTSS
jgi:arsenate reductase-like glutaredoxin family protein